MDRELITKLVLEIRNLEVVKGRPNTKPRIKQLRKKILGLMPDYIYCELEDFVIEKTYNPALGKSYVLIFTKDSFKKRNHYELLRRIS